MAAKAIYLGILMAGIAVPVPQYVPEAVESVESGNVDPGVDPIQTGSDVSPQMLQRWKALNARYDQCGTCGEEQPFPGDIGTDRSLHGG